eukprot:CAMPEP_0195626830 /NCGR_PEP_ID=MMETSP0815-20121206/18590_1 /TAXON_ID=97485 /ORGANISM="Prymnesium parvum, Strain Texoma1" /LENGTH=211 /DNA_ID=CAMNT_0040767989 /DNA_START=346 /DNA_END=983 /DNA_ORIENTATION=-
MSRSGLQRRRSRKRVPRGVLEWKVPLAPAGSVGVEGPARCLVGGPLGTPVLWTCGPLALLLLVNCLLALTDFVFVSVTCCGKRVCGVLVLRARTLAAVPAAAGCARGSLGGGGVSAAWCSSEVPGGRGGGVGDRPCEPVTLAPPLCPLSAESAATCSLSSCSWRWRCSAESGAGEALGDLSGEPESATAGGGSGGGTGAAARPRAIYQCLW